MREDILDELALAVAEGAEPGLSCQGVLQIRLGDTDKEDYCFLALDDKELTYGIGLHPRPTAAIYLDEGNFRRLQQGNIQLRDPPGICQPQTRWRSRAHPRNY